MDKSYETGGSFIKNILLIDFHIFITALGHRGSVLPCRYSLTQSSRSVPQWPTC